MTDDITIRPFDTTSEADYDSLAAIIRAAQPEYPLAPAGLRDDDRVYLETGKPFGRLFALDRDGVPVGFAEYSPALWRQGAGKFYLKLMVRPEHQGHGIGRRLYDTLRHELDPHAPTTLKIEWREDMSRAVRFFGERGFREVSRHYESRLDIADFDLAPFAGDQDRPMTHGIRIVSWPELKAGDANADHKLWAATMEMSPDVPSDEPFEPLDYETFQKVIMERPAIDPDGFFVAIDERSGEYAGLSHIWRRLADNDLDTGLTAVKRGYRRRGIALALKLHVIRWAQAGGFHALRTENEINNRPMLAINERLGFIKEPPWIEFVWKL